MSKLIRWLGVLCYCGLFIYGTRRYEKNRIFHQLRVKSLIDVDFKFLKYIVSAIELLRHREKSSCRTCIYTIQALIYLREKNKFFSNTAELEKGNDKPSHSNWES